MKNIFVVRMTILSSLLMILTLDSSTTFAGAWCKRALTLAPNWERFDATAHSAAAAASEALGISPAGAENLIRNKLAVNGVDYRNAGIVEYSRKVSSEPLVFEIVVRNNDYSVKGRFHVEVN